MRLTAATVIGASTLLLLAGCVGEGQQAPTEREQVLHAADQAREAGHDEQYEAMKDGEVDLTDYDEAFTRFADCLQDGGLTVDDPIVSPIDGLRYLFSFAANGLAPEVVDKVQADCQSRFWLPISTLYVDTHEQVMDEAVRVRTLECLADDGYELTGDETSFPQMIGDPDADGGAQLDAATTCVFDVVHDLHPEISELSVSA